jgi:hypothetical protein
MERVERIRALLLTTCMAACSIDAIDVDESAVQIDHYEAAISAAPAPIELGQRLTVTWSAPATHSPYDFVRWHRATAPDSENVPQHYVRGFGQPSGEMTFLIPLTEALDTGPWNFRYYAADGTKLATSNTVVGFASHDVTPESADVELGQPWVVTWQAPLAHSTHDVVSLYKVGATEQLLQYYRVEGGGQRTGTLTLRIQYRLPFDPGPYELRYRVGTTTVATSAPLHLYADYGVTPDAPCRSGLPLPASWTAPLAHLQHEVIRVARVGAPSSSYVAFAYVGGAGQRSGGVVIPGFAAGPGLYELRYCDNNLVLGTSPAFGCPSSADGDRMAD